MAGENGEGRRIVRGRVALGLLGALAGASSWYLAGRLPEILPDPQVYLFVTALIGGTLAVALALVGPLRLASALAAAPLTALPAAALLSWASQRHDTLAGFFGRPEPLIAYLIVLFLPLPYLIAGLRRGTSWRDYPTLFAESWSIVVRIASAAVFAAVVWLALLLSDELLQLVGIDIVERLLRIDWLPATFTGLVAGLALAIVCEMADQITPGLILRLLRLMIPPALLVVGLFLAAIPVQGLGRLFGTLSPAATLLGMATALTLLIAAGVDSGKETAPRSALAGWSVRALALLLPVLSLLALEALRLRYVDHGLSPDRLAAALAALVLLAYGVLYALAVLTGRGWRARIRSANGWMALAVIALAGLWLTPALDAERLSANDQVARFEAGEVAAIDLDLWTLWHDWGRAGRAGFARIEALAPAHAESALLAERLRLARQAPSRAAFQDIPTSPALLNARAELKRLMPVMPPEAAAEFDRYVLPWYAGSVANFLDGCRDPIASGAPGCVLVVYDLIPDNAGNEAILFYKSFGLLRGEVIVPEPVFRRADAAEVFSLPPPDFAETDRLIGALQAGQFEAGQARINAISIGGRQFTVPF